MAAPVTVIIAYDLRFYDNLPRLFPHCPAMRDMFVNNPQLIQDTCGAASGTGLWADAIRTRTLGPRTIQPSPMLEFGTISFKWLGLSDTWHTVPASPVTPLGSGC